MLQSQTWLSSNYEQKQGKDRGLTVIMYVIFEYLYATTPDPFSTITSVGELLSTCGILHGVNLKLTNVTLFKGYWLIDLRVHDTCLRISPPVHLV